MFKGLALVEKSDPIGGLMYSLGENKRSLGIVSQSFADDKVIENGYYEMADSFRLVRKENQNMSAEIKIESTHSPTSSHRGKRLYSNC